MPRTNLYLQFAPFPQAGLLYEQAGPFASGPDANALGDALLGPESALALPRKMDVAVGRLFEKLNEVKKLFVHLGRDWKNADLVGFALEQVPHMLPEWVRKVPIPLVRRLVATMVAARHAFIAKNSGILGDDHIVSYTAMAISAYDRMDLMPFADHVRNWNPVWD